MITGEKLKASCRRLLAKQPSLDVSALLADVIAYVEEQARREPEVSVADLVESHLTLLAKLPESIRDSVAAYACEQGNAFGHREILCTLENIVRIFAPYLAGEASREAARAWVEAAHALRQAKLTDEVGEAFLSLTKRVDVARDAYYALRAAQPTETERAK